MSDYTKITPCLQTGESWQQVGHRVIENLPQ